MKIEKLTYDGKTLTLAQWAKEIGISKVSIGERLALFDFEDREEFLRTMTDEQKIHLLRPKTAARNIKKYGGKTPSEWAAEKGVSRTAIHLRLKKIGTKFNSVQEAMDF